MSLKLRKVGDSASGSAAENRNKPSRLLQFGVIAVVAIVVYVGGLVLNYSPSAARVEPTQTPMLQVVITPTVEATATPTMLAAVFDVDPLLPVATSTPVVVTATPTPEPLIEYVPYEVTRVVEVTPFALPSPTPTATPALAAGTVKICASVEGASALYVGGQGVVSGGCQVFSFGVGQTSIQVQVNK